MENHERIDAMTALNDIERIDRKVRSDARWHGWVWLFIGVATPVFLIGTTIASGDLRFLIAVAFGVAGLLLWGWSARRHVTGREAALLDNPLTWIYASLVFLASIAIMTVLPEHFTIWLLLVGLLPALPCLYGAWRILRQ